MKALVPLMLRLPAMLHAQLKESAETNQRSLNREIVYRLTRSFEQNYRR